ncbi:hypothetical protein [Enterococcus phage vB_EhiS_268]|uniref:Uncharacterized protein n=1 Tax=Enterococcus phage vB_EhiS_268 TaxID=2736817 RepID=A0ACA9AT82_9CAUD|nr:hypothetical protein [Enterococcus phage vB_EhiS_268]
MFTITVTKYNGGNGITEEEYNHIEKYKITDDYLILDADRIKTHIQKNQVLEFEVYYE